MSQRKLLKESFLYAVGNVLQKLGDFVFIPVFTYYLTVQEYGNLSLYLSVIPLLLLLFQQGTRAGFLRLYYEYEGQERQTLYTTVLLYNIAASAALIAGACIFRGAFSGLITANLTFFPTGILILLIAFTNNVFQLNLAYFQVKHKAGFYVLYSLLCFLCRYGLIVGLIVITKMGLHGYLAGYLAANIVLVLLPNLIYLAKWRPPFSINHLMPLLTFSLPVVPHLVSTWIYNLSSRIIVEKYVSTEDYAVFSLGANIALAFSVLVTSFSLAWGPHYLRTATQSDNAAKILKKDIHLVAKLFSMLFIGLLLFSKELVLIAGRKQIYHSAYKIMPSILLGYFFLLLYVLLANSFYLRKKTFALSLISVSTAVFSILNLSYGTKYYGIQGAAAAMAINYLVLLLSVAYFSNRLFPIPVGRTLSSLMIINTACAICITYINSITDITPVSLLLKTCALLILLSVTIGKDFCRTVGASVAAEPAQCAEDA
jgi:O-antigen/teichoic acid export membrane protein